MKTFEHEPVAGLPEKLPKGEHILWQGAPSWKNLARYTFKVRLIAVYFLFFAGLRGVVAYADGAPLGQAFASAAMVLPLAAAGLGFLLLLAWAHARTTLYTLTNRRVVMRYGIALQMMVNLPFKSVISAGFKRRAHGEGDLPIRLGGGTGPGYIHLWPHVRPWRVTRPEPMLRGIADVESVAKRFAEALISFREAENARSRETETQDDEESIRLARVTPDRVESSSYHPRHPAGGLGAGHSMRTS